METMQYREIQRAKGALLAIAYVAVIGTALVLTFGFDKMADFTNSGGIRAKGLAIGIVVLSPLFLLVRLIYPTVRLEFDEREMRIIRKGSLRVIPYADIGGIVVNRPALSHMILENQSGETLMQLRPFHSPDLARMVAAALEKRITFLKTTSKGRLLNTTYEVVKYQRTTF